MYQCFNIYAWYGGNSGKNSVAHILNAFINALNNRAFLPKYILFVIEDDIIQDTKPFDHGITHMLEKQLSWLLKQVNKYITRCRDDLHDKKLGALSSNFEPRVIWLKMINPLDLDIEHICKARSVRARFNARMNNILISEKYMHIMAIMDVYDYPQKYFDNFEKLSTSGLSIFWKEVDRKLRKFDRRKLELRLIPISTSKNKEVNNRFLLPNPGKSNFPKKC